MAYKSNVKTHTYHYNEKKFVKRFRKVYEQYAEYAGKAFKVLGPARQSKVNLEEVGPMFRIQFANGKKITAWPEEVCALV